MSWLFSQALVAEYSAGNCSAGEPCAPSKTTPMPQAYLPSDKMTDFSRPSRFGMTFAPLTESLGEAVLTSFLADFPARTSAQPDEARESPEPEAGFGLNSLASLAKYDPDTRSWKTAQYSLLGGLEPYSETWPRWGSMRDGECWEQTPSAPPISGTESGLWQTPVADDAVDRKAGEYNSRGEPKLSTQVKLWPTPIANDAQKRGNFDPRRSPGLAASVKLWPTPQARDHFPTHKPEYVAKKKAEGYGMSNLNDAVAMVPTPQAHDWKSGTGWDASAQKERGHTPQLRHVCGGQLNPTWVEWLMGWPLGWTDLQPSATDKYPSAPLPHGDYSMTANAGAQQQCQSDNHDSPAL